MNQQYYAERQHTVTWELQKISTVLTWSLHAVGLHTAIKVTQLDLLLIITKSKKAAKAAF